MLLDELPLLLDELPLLLEELEVCPPVPAPPEPPLEELVLCPPVPSPPEPPLPGGLGSGSEPQATMIAGRAITTGRTLEINDTRALRWRELGICTGFAPGNGAIGRDYRNLVLDESIVFAEHNSATSFVALDGSTSGGVSLFSRAEMR